MLNLLGLKVEEAGGKGAELILLPEDGIHGYGFTRSSYQSVASISSSSSLTLRETIPGFLEPLLEEGENPCQLLEELSDAGEAWEDWYQKYYAQVASREILFSSSFFGGVGLKYERTILEAFS